MMGNKLNKENESKGENRRAKKKDTCCKIHSQKKNHWPSFTEQTGEERKVLK